MGHIFLLLGIILNLVNFTSALHETYYIDKSCSERGDWDVYWQEYRDMTRLTSSMLVEEDNTDFATAFSQLYRAKISDQASFKKVEGMSTANCIHSYSQIHTE